MTSHNQKKLKIVNNKIRELGALSEKQQSIIEWFNNEFDDLGFSITFTQGDGWNLFNHETSNIYSNR